METRKEVLRLLFAIFSTCVFIMTLSTQYDQQTRYEIHSALRSAVFEDQILQVANTDELWEWTTTFTRSLLGTVSPSPFGGAFPFSDPSTSDLSAVMKGRTLADRSKGVCFLGNQNLVVGGVMFSQKRMVASPHDPSDPLSVAYGDYLPVEASSFTGYRDARDFVRAAFDRWGEPFVPASTVSSDTGYLYGTSEQMGLTKGPLRDPRVFELCFRDEELLDSFDPACGRSQTRHWSEEMLAILSDELDNGGNWAKIAVTVNSFGPAIQFDPVTNKTQVTEFVLEDLRGEWSAVVLTPSRVATQYVTEVDEDERAEVCLGGCRSWQLCESSGSQATKVLQECTDKCMTDVAEYVMRRCSYDHYVQWLNSHPQVCNEELAQYSQNRCPYDAHVEYKAAQVTSSTAESDTVLPAVVTTSYEYGEFFPRSYIGPATRPTPEGEREMSELLEHILSQRESLTPEDGFKLTVRSKLINEADGSEESTCLPWVLAGAASWNVLLENAEGTRVVTVASTDALYLTSNNPGVCHSEVETPLVVGLPDDRANPTPRAESPMFVTDVCNGTGFFCFHFWSVPHLAFASACENVMSGHRDIIKSLSRSIVLTDSDHFVKHWMDYYFNCQTKVAATDFVHHVSPFNRVYDGFTAFLDCSQGRLHPNLSISFLELMLLKHSEWIDSFTSEVEVSFITYNGNSNFATHVTISFRWASSGFIHPEVTMDSIVLDYFPGTQHKTSQWEFRLLFEILFIMTVVVSTATHVLSWRKASSFKHWLRICYSTLLDILRLVLAYYLIASQIVILWQSSEFRDTLSHKLGLAEGAASHVTLDLMQPLRQDIMGLSSVKSRYTFVAGCELLVYAAWTFSHFRHPRLAVVTKTLSGTIGDLSHVLVVFVVILSVFTMMASLYFGQDHEGYSSFGTAINTLLRMLFGDFDYDSLSATDEVRAFLFFWSFQIVVFLVIFNIVLAIVVNAYTDYQSELKEHDEPPNLFRDILFLVTRNVQESTQAVTRRLSSFVAKENEFVNVSEDDGPLSSDVDSRSSGSELSVRSLGGTRGWR